MSTLAKTGLAAMAMVLMAAPAQASGSGWWSVPDDAVKATLKRTSAGGADRVRAYALCSVKRSRKAVETLLDTRQESLEERAASHRLTQLSFDCMPSGNFTFGGLSVRGSLAEAMFWTNYAAANVEALSVRSDEAGEKERFADCAADGRLDEIRTLIGTEPNSSAEGAALSALMPRLRECIAKTNFSSMDNASARSLMAEALYRAAKRGPQS